MDPFGLKIILITCVIFILLERLLALHAEQKIFRRGWANDLIFLLLNGVLIKFGLLGVMLTVMYLAAWVVPSSVRAAVAALPVWVEIPAVIPLSDLGFY